MHSPVSSLPHGLTLRGSGIGEKNSWTGFLQCSCDKLEEKMCCPSPQLQGPLQQTSPLGSSHPVKMKS